MVYIIVKGQSINDQRPNVLNVLRVTLEGDMVVASALDDGPEAPFVEERRCRKCAALLVIVAANELGDSWACKCCDQATKTCPHQSASAFD